MLPIGSRWKSTPSGLYHYTVVPAPTPVSLMDEGTVRYLLENDEQVVWVRMTVGATERVMCVSERSLLAYCESVVPVVF